MPIINDENSEDQGNYYVAPTGITIGGRVKEYATYADMFADRNPGRYARVADASADPTVGSGGALYRRSGSTWTKVYEEEVMDQEAVTWETLSGKPANTAAQIESAVENTHSHSNKTTLDNFGVNASNKLTYNGSTLEDQIDLSSYGQVKSVNSVSPDANGNVAITIPDISGKQDAITGTEGQLVVIGSNGTPEAQTVNLTQGTVTSVNNVSPDATGNVTIDINDTYGVKYVTSMETPSAANLGNVVIFVGSNGTYKTGGIYKVTSSTNPETSVVSYAWTLISIADGVVKSVNSKSPDANGAVSLDLSDLSDTTNILAGKQAAITGGTEGQFVKVGANGAITTATVSIPGDVSDLTDTNGVIKSDIKDLADSTNIIAGKQSKITGTSGQFVKINASGEAEATTVDLSVYGSVKSVNNVSPDENGNVSLTIPADLTDRMEAVEAQSLSALGTATTNSGRLDTVESGKQDKITGTEGQFVKIGSTGYAVTETVDLSSLHTHETENNYDYFSKFMGCTDSNAYKTLNEMSLITDGTTLTMEEFAANENISIKAFTTGYTAIGGGSLIWAAAPSSTFNGTFTDLTGSLTGITDAAISGVSVVAALSGTTLYVKGAPNIANANLTAIPTSGNLLGATTTISKTEWAAVSGSYTAIESHGDHWLAIGTSGELYTAGSNKFHMQNLDSYTGVLNTLTQVTISGLASGETIIKAGAGRNFSLAMSEYNNGANHKIYAWGRQINGELADGVSYLHDSDSLKYHAFENSGNYVYVVLKTVATGTNADPFSDGSKTLAAGTEVYSFDNHHVEFVGTTDADATNLTADGSTISVGGVTYSRASSNDFEGYSLGSKTPTAIKIPSLGYAFKNASGAIVYTNTDTPAKNTKVYSNGTLSTQMSGSCTAGGYGYLVYGGVTYNRSYYDDYLISETVCDDWIKMSAGYYHAGALRKNSNGETEVYLWGSNEYGQLGTGYYKLDSLTTSALTGSAAASVEIINRPMKLSSDLFPYTDVIDIQCTHYGTFLTRANGKVYFAGCNKRNYLGTGVLSEETAFIPKFIALSTSFTKNKVYAETYGSIVVHKVPLLDENADPLIQAAFSELTTEKLDSAISAAHNHAIDPSLIDSVTIGAAQYIDQLPSVIDNMHTHTNLSSLNSLSVRNNNLYINGSIYRSGGGSDSGVSITVDESNIQLDKLTDISGLNNLAGGLGLEIISYHRLDDSDDSAGAIIQVAPIGNVINQHGRYVTLYYKSGNNYTAIPNLSAENQSRGLYAYLRTGSSSYSYTDKGAIHSTRDLITAIDSVKSSTAASPTLVLYYVDVANKATPRNGVQFAAINKDTLTGYGTLYWQMETGSTVQPNSEYLTTDKLAGVGLGSYDSEDDAFFDVYLTGETTPVIEADDFGDATNGYNYFDENGNAITSAAAMVVPAGTDEEGKLVYHTIYDNNTQSGTPIITSEQIKAGLRMKIGTSYMKIHEYMIPEKFDENLFTGTIYIHPGITNFSGMANHIYEFNPVLNSGFACVYGTYANPDGSYPLEKVIIKLNTALISDDASGSTTFNPTAGTLDNPLYAAIYSANRYYTSTAMGEFNSAVGFNSIASGNQNTVVGEFSTADGLCNVVAGRESFAQGTYNVVTGSSSNAYGYGNLIGGSQNIAVGSGNLTHGYYSFVFGDGNQTFGNNDIAIGMKNVLYATMGGGIAIGDNNILREKAKDSISVGTYLDVYAESATVIGQKGKIERFASMTNNNNFFPGEDYDVLKTITAAQWETAGYDDIFLSNKEGMFFCAGERNAQSGKVTTTTVTPMAFTRYRVRPNNAYFGQAANASGRSSIDPYIYEPFMQWSITGVITMSFTDPQVNANDATKFTFTKRNGGRVKSFDPGIELNEHPASELFELNFDKATRWKIKTDDSEILTLIPSNFVDGAEAYVVLYAGADVSWEAFTSSASSSQVEGVNLFDALVWTTDDHQAPAATGSTGFILIKLMIVDNTCIASVVANTLA